MLGAEGLVPVFLMFAGVCAVGAVAAMGIADGIMKVDGKVIYEAKGLKVGLFTDAATVSASA